MGKFKEIDIDVKNQDWLKVILMIGLIIAGLIILGLRNELIKAKELRLMDLEVINVYIDDNLELQKENEQLKKDYEYVVDIIRASDKYSMPESEE